MREGACKTVRASHLRVDGEHAAQQVAALSRDEVRGLEITPQHTAVEIVRRVALEGEVARQHAEQQNPERPDVDGRPDVRLARDDLRRGVGGGAAEGLELLARAEGGAEAEVDDLADAARVEQAVLELDVAVHDVVRVTVVDAARDLSEQPPRLILLQTTLRPHVLAQVTAARVLDDEAHPLGRVDHLEQLDDGRVLDALEVADLADDALARAVVTDLELFEDLDRHLLAAEVVVGELDLAKRPLSEHTADGVELHRGHVDRVGGTAQKLGDHLLHAVRVEVLPTALVLCPIGRGARAARPALQVRRPRGSGLPAFGVHSPRLVPVLLGRCPPRHRRRRCAARLLVPPRRWSRPCGRRRRRFGRSRRRCTGGASRRGRWRPGGCCRGGRRSSAVGVRGLGCRVLGGLLSRLAKRVVVLGVPGGDGLLVSPHHGVHRRLLLPSLVAAGPVARRPHSLARPGALRPAPIPRRRGTRTRGVADGGRARAVSGRPDTRGHCRGPRLRVCRAFRPRIVNVQPDSRWIARAGDGSA